ncbi:hypothetical protein DAPPUDRAFT_104015 [Daphnia pulex]|uniref:Uncharacterized protein n=1 Tax=Daphnia pulex TaxID=6669 RepID=E9GL19_DAPPU|nr:hypothetical protein DAPPUDRAFT_104015 [Daphnia pulex]|eukprot:EFX79868.1 hypothetical protein DAPPUDRAFT_104015 [Daphnia pulex]
MANGIRRFSARSSKAKTNSQMPNKIPTRCQCRMLFENNPGNFESKRFRPDYTLANFEITSADKSDALHRITETEITNPKLVCLFEEQTGVVLDRQTDEFIRRLIIIISSLFSVSSRFSQQSTYSLCSLYGAGSIYGLPYFF